MIFDEILERIGPYGLYQKRVLFLATLVAIPVAMHAVGSVFLAASMDHWCSVYDAGEGGGSGSEADYCGGPVDQRNATLCEYLKQNIIPLDEDGEYQQCSRYNSSYDGTGPYDPSIINETEIDADTMQCDQGWVYDRSQYKTSIVSEFDLVCDRSYLVGIASSIYFAGVLIGSLVTGMLADWIGRFPTFLVCVGLTSSLGITTAFTQSYTAFVTLRFFLGASNLGMYMMIFIIGTEIVGPSKRIVCGILVAAQFGVGVSLFAVLAYFFRYWRTLQLIISAPMLLLFLLALIMHESPRWLFTRGKFERAEKIICKMAAVNQTEVPEELLKREEKESDVGKQESYTQLDLFRTPVMRKKTLIILFNWFVINMVYYGLSLSTSSLGVNDYVACFLSGAVEVPASLLSWYVIQKYGRRSSHSVFMVIGGLACLITTMLPLGVARTVIAMIGKFGLTAGFCIIYIYSGEIYPTVVRSMGMGVSSMAARLSGVLSPIILMLESYWTPLPLIVFGSCSILAGLLTLMLPETRKRPLPETLQDGETFEDLSHIGLPSCLKIGEGKGAEKSRPEANYEKVDTDNNVV